TSSFFSLSSITLLVVVGAGSACSKDDGDATQTTTSSTTTSSTTTSSTTTSSTAAGGGGTGGDVSNAGAGGTGGGGATSSGGSGGTGGCGGATPVEYTLKNYLAWCSVSVEGGAPSAASQQVVCLAEGTKVDLVATPVGGFILGPDMWHHTDFDLGSGEPGVVANGTSSTTDNATGATTCAWVCCPFANGTGCNVPDQCP
ncbi:MAG: hypothetical protein IT373_29235, partial [Polyangiaceae bacterium]|nr:hypothetical protein [Polyangiaceae bacterium]